jgi:hypothetical protein
VGGFRLLVAAELTTGLGRLQIAKVFWKAMVYCLILNWAALNDGVSFWIS